MYCLFYIRKGKAFIPTTAHAEAGYWMSVEPVDVIEPLTLESLKVALLVTIARGNPVIPTFSRQNFPRPVMERYCGLKSLSVFERSATCWAIAEYDYGFYITEWKQK